ncbi:Tetratricopeptide-like helical domain superfamily [Sesbania bispinosa]|nr:Tetratricopeptide-like helical domain superfamily [Sesbania bispinosa]
MLLASSKTSSPSSRATSLPSNARDSEISLVLRHGLDLDDYVFNALVTCCCRCDEIELARNVFNGMVERDLVSWNSMNGGYSQCGFYEECKRLYLEMLSVAGVSPNAVTFMSWMQACGQSKDLVFGMEVHRFTNESGIEMDVSLCNVVIAMYVKCGSLEYAREFFEEMRMRFFIGQLFQGTWFMGF